MTLATVGADGRPSTRAVLIKDVDERGIVWYTNYQSRKAHELADNPCAALQFHWVELERVVRIEGRVEKVDPAESRSRVTATGGVGVKSVGEERPGSGRPPPRPQHWGGYRLVPDTWEFWQGRKSRLHDRIRYRLVAGLWTRERLAP